MTKIDSKSLHEKFLELKYHGNSAKIIRKKLNIETEFDYHLIVLEMLKEIVKESEKWIKFEYDDSKFHLLLKAYTMYELGDESFHDLLKKIKFPNNKNFDLEKFKIARKYQNVWINITILNSKLHYDHSQWIGKTINLLKYFPEDN